ncbi:unnamed protein product [Ectocarpus sp. 12 AP-2014]
MSCLPCERPKPACMHTGFVLCRHFTLLCVERCTAHATPTITYVCKVEWHHPSTVVAIFFVCWVLRFAVYLRKCWRLIESCYFYVFLITIIMYMWFILFRSNCEPGAEGRTQAVVERVLLCLGGKVRTNASRGTRPPYWISVVRTDTRLFPQHA